MELLCRFALVLAWVLASGDKDLLGILRALNSVNLLPEHLHKLAEAWPSKASSTPSHGIMRHASVPMQRKRMQLTSRKGSFSCSFP